MSDLPNIPLATKLLHQLNGIDCRSQERCEVSWSSDFYLPCPLSLTLSFLRWFQTCFWFSVFPIYSPSCPLSKISCLCSLISPVVHSGRSCPIPSLQWTFSLGSAAWSVLRAHSPSLFSWPRPILSIPPPDLFISQHQMQTAHSLKCCYDVKIKTSQLAIHKPL